MLLETRELQPQRSSFIFAPNRKYYSWKLFDALNIQSLVGVPPRETPGNDPFEG